MNMNSEPKKRRNRGRRGRGRGYGRQHRAQGGRYNDGGSNRLGGRGWGGRGKRDQPLGNNILEEMAHLEPRETLHRLSAFKDNLRRSVQTRNVQFRSMIHMVGALSNACRCNTSKETLVEILSILQGEGFVTDHLMQFIQECQMPNMDIMYPSYMNMLPSLLSSVMTILFSFLSNLPDSVYDVDELIQCLDFSMQIEYPYNLPDDLFDAVKVLHDLSEDVMDEVDQWGPNNPGWDGTEPVPLDDFRGLPIFPMVEELQEDHFPFLRKNIVDRGYASVEHYLDIQFRLLREDLVAPLREGIAEFRAHRRSNSNQMHMKLQDIYVYHDVRVLEAKPEHDGIVHITRFNVRLLSKVQWEQSKRLVFGSLVCLSTDNFATVTFAVVNGSDRRGLSRGMVQLRFHQGSSTTRLMSTTFTMVESSAYFEAYRHVLKRLQCITQATFPLKRYIVDTSPVIYLPEYLRQNRNALYLLQPVARCNGAQYTRVARPENWPAPDYFDLDQSQFEAFKAALTEELCCIQGPPGTGKTFIGLKIVQTLLLNKSVWSPDGENHPILLICFTNHALDQFLEGVLEFAPKGIIRIGGRSSSEKLKKFNLKEIRNERSRLKQRPRHQYLQLKGIRNEMLRLANLMRPLQKSIRTANTKVLFDSRLRDFIPTVQWRNLLVGIPAEHTAFLVGQCIALWLGVVETKVGMPTTERQEFGTHKAYSGVPRDDVRDVLNQHPHGDGKIEVRGEAEIMEARRYLDDGNDEPDGELDEVLHAMAGEEEEDEDLFNIRQEPTIRVPHLENREGSNTGKSVSAYLGSVDDMPEGRAHSVKHVWRLPNKERWMLYRYWVRLFKESTQAELRPLHDQYEKQARLLKEARLDENYDIIRGSSVLALTTTGAAKYHDLIKLVQPRIVVVEEAAEVLEAHIVTSLTESCQHLILIGDHQQLRPNPTVYRLEQEYDLHISLFERLVTNKFPKHRLSLQHRMRPEIAELLKVHRDFYPDLRDAYSVKEYADVRGMETNVYFMNHSHTESGDSETHSKSNEFEAAFLARLCQYFLHQEYLPQQITILTAYTGQLWQFRKHMPKDVFQDVHVCPVDSYQGEENDIIILSFVRSNDRGNIGFLKTANRICVALSRARKGLYCVGNFSLLSGKTTLWQAITNCLQRRGYLGNSMPLRCSNHPEIFTAVNTVQDFMKVPEGGCTKPCEATLECGHYCPIKVCHPRNPKHVGIECREECSKFLCDRKHKCRKLCYEKCNAKCNSPVRVLLYCGHEKKTQCHKRFSTDIECQEPCKRILRCGHPCERNCADSCTDLCEVMVLCTSECGHRYSKKCYEESEPTECKVKVPRKLTCGHTRMIRCSRKSSTGIQCDQLCSKLLKCGHSCRKKCCESCTDKCTTLKTFSFPCGHSYRKPCYGEIDEACKLTVENPLPCGHIKKVPCYMEATDVKCNNPCPKTLACGHPCTQKCGRSCTVICESPKTISFSCGHQYRGLCYEGCDGMCKLIVEKTLSCGHRKKLKCYQRTTDVKCKKPCSKTLKCGHQCQENCGDSCTITCMQTGSLDSLCEHLQHKPCFLIVDRKCRIIIRRKLPCGHSRIIQCHNRNSTDLQCEESCQKLLKCRHSCKKKCGETCDCTLVVTKEFTCGHAVKVRCGDTKLECGKPCGKILKCGHTCTGTCRQCRQGRLHIPCAQPCGNILICGHSCKSLCAAFCPPCDMEVCENACTHMKCRKRCSDPCTPCPDECDSACKHTSCSRLCCQPCVRRPCERPCRKLLQKCGHPCIGMCGDTCPTLCRVCNSDQFKAIDAVSRFVQLEDCRHLIEVKRLDKWMAKSSDNDECIQVKACPACTTSIRRNARYTSAIGETRKDVEYVKNLLGNSNRLLSADIAEKRGKLLMELSSEDAGTRGASYFSKYTSLLKYRKEPAFDGPTVRRFVRRFREQLNSCSSSSTMAALSLKMEMFKRLCELRRETRRIEDRHETAREKLVLSWVFEDILQWLDEMKDVSEQSLDDWKDESGRISSIQKLMETRVLLLTVRNSSLNVIMTEIFIILSRRTQRADVIQRSIVDRKFQQLEKSVPGLNRERIETSLSFKNVGGYPSSSDWFKCRYGHYYWWGTSKRGECPECNTGRQFRWGSLLRKDSGLEV